MPFTLIQAHREKQSDCGAQQHREEKQPSDRTIKQEPNGIDLWNCELGEQNSREESEFTFLMVFLPFIIM